jgi:hypothetical protein
MQVPEDYVYAGLDFRVGTAGWIPDLVNVVVEEALDRVSVTLIELEATEPAALTSCRKYLPEKSVSIVNALSLYLDRVVRQCRSNADPREAQFAKLRATLSQGGDVRVSTAGALRSSHGFVEELLLIDQPKAGTQAGVVQKQDPEKRLDFRGVLRLSARDAKALSRCIMILDAVIRCSDHSSATLHAWRPKAPLKRLLREHAGDCPALQALIFKSQHGATIDCEEVLPEIAEIWRGAYGGNVDAESARKLIEGYFPAASRIGKHEQMAHVFEAAWKHLH